MKSTMKQSCLALLGLGLLLACEGKKDSKKTETPGTDVPVVPVPTEKGFFFVDEAQAEFPIYVRGSMNGWFGDAANAAERETYRLSFSKDTGCYTGTMTLAANSYSFKLATYLEGIDNSGWNHFKVGIGAAGTSTVVELAAATPVDVYYFPKGDANGKDSGGGGDFSLELTEEQKLEFKLCADPVTYTTASLTINKL